MKNVASPIQAPASKRAKTERSEDVIVPTYLICHDHIADCYDEAMMNDEICVYHDWLIDQKWFSQTTFKDPSITKGKINALYQQLVQVKRNLMPTAVHASKASKGMLTPYQIFSKARRICNPFEILGEGRAGGLNNIFINRSAIKLANINSNLGFVLTSAAERGKFYFLDLCAAPGGFSEYLFHYVGRCFTNDTEIRGIGMSLAGGNEHCQGIEWKLHNYQFKNMHYHIFNGADGTGDIYNWDNVLALKNLIQDSPIDAVFCDGGIDAQRDHEDQEQVAQKLVVCQVAAGLSILSCDGSMLIKLFGFQTQITQTMIKELAFLFKDFIVTKPISSRPASAERYLVLYGFNGLPTSFDGRKWRDSMFLGLPTVRNNSDVDSRVLAYLELTDHALIQLNLKACFAILSMMQQHQTLLSESPNRNEHHVVVAEYKKAWRL
jgi:cap1 methyltransferase